MAGSNIEADERDRKRKADKEVADRQRAKRRALFNAQTTLLKFRRKQTEYFLNVAAEVQALRATMNTDAEFDTISWLRNNLGFSKEQAEVALAIQPDLIAERATFAKLATPPDTLYALSRCDAGTRSRLVERLKLGEPLGRSTIRNLDRVDIFRDISSDDIALLRRKDVLALAGKRAGEALVDKLQSEASELYELFDIAVSGLGHWLDERGLDDDYSPLVRAVAQKADEVLSIYRQLFGLQGPIRAGDPDVTARHDFVANISFEIAAQTLEQLRLGSDGFRERTDSYFVRTRRDMHELDPKVLRRRGGYDPQLDRDVRTHLQFLAGDIPLAVPMHVAAGSHRRRWPGPSFVDIDAGVGGMALGLVAAGFHPASIFTKSFATRDAITANRLLKNVHMVPQAEFDSAVEKLEGTEPDLITCGIPWHEYKHGDAIQAFKNAMQTVLRVKPRAFLFEARSEAFDADHAQSFRDNGYDIKWHEMNGADFGLAQAKKRKLMIGSRGGYLDDFIMPTLRNRRPVYLHEVIGDLIGGHDFHEPLSPDAKTEYDALLDEKRRKLINKSAPAFRSPFDFRCVQKWQALGINIKGGFTDGPPSLEELRSPDGFRLSTAMVKRIQSFPDDWIIGSDFSSNAEETADAFPPVLAKMVGLAMHSAMLRIKFDYDRAIQRHLVGITDEHPAKKPVWEIPHPRYAVASTNYAFEPGRFERAKAKPSTSAAGETSE